MMRKSIKSGQSVKKRTTEWSGPRRLMVAYRKSAKAVGLFHAEGGRHSKGVTGSGTAGTEGNHGAVSQRWLGLGCPFGCPKEPQLQLIPTSDADNLKGTRPSC